MNVVCMDTWRSVAELMDSVEASLPEAIGCVARQWMLCYEAGYFRLKQRYHWQWSTDSAHVWCMQFLTRKAKHASHCPSTIDECQHNPRALWKTVNNMLQWPVQSTTNKPSFLPTRSPKFVHPLLQQPHHCIIPEQCHRWPYSNRQWPNSNRQ